MYSGGYTGKILRVDLTSKTFAEEPLPEQVARDFIGGAGFTVKYLFDEVPADCDPLGPDNKLIYACGPFTGTRVPCASRMAVNAKSPATGAMGVAMTGGHFPVELKRAGYDVLIIEGRAAKPIYLWIKDGQVRFRDAADLWGLTTSDCQQVIKDELKDQNVRVSCIGPAGEKLAYLACIVNERRVAGRKGLGAVMGSKNLKAIALRGDQKMEIADAEAFKVARKRMLDAMKNSPVLYSEFAKVGTSGNVDNCTALGIFPARNWTATGMYDFPETIGSQAIATRGVGRTACAECPVACSQLRLAQTAPYTGIMTEGPEYETLYSFGGVTGVDNPDAIIAADRMSDEFGLDTMSAGVTIAFAMELFERGILTLDDTGGMDLSFGNHEAMVEAAAHDGRARRPGRPAGRRLPRRRRARSAGAPRSTPCTSRASSCRPTTCAAPRGTASATPPPTPAPTTTRATPSRRSSGCRSPTPSTALPSRARASSRCGTRTRARRWATAPRCASSCSTPRSRPSCSRTPPTS